MYRNVVAAAAELASETCCRVKWSKQKKMYECTRCGYASERKSNVGRHFRRIHCELKKHKICVVCEKSFSTKGEFYEHCEKEHPHVRHSCYITSEKYKIGRKQNNNRRRNQARKSQRARAASRKRASIDDTSEEETSDSSFCDVDKENVKRNEENPAEFEETEEYETYEETEEEYQGLYEENRTEQKIIEPVDDLQKVDHQHPEIDYVIPMLHEVDIEKVIVEEISELYAPFPCKNPENDNDDSLSWSHKANESFTSSPVRSLRTDYLSPILWTPPRYELPTTPNSTPEPDEFVSSPKLTIKSDDFLFSPARSDRTDDFILSPARSHKDDSSLSSSASSAESDDYLSSAKVDKSNEFMLSTKTSPNVFPSTSECSSKADLSISFTYCNMSPSCTEGSAKVNTYSSVRTLPLKKRFGNLNQRKQLADITNVQNNEFNVKSRFNNNELQVANRNFSVVNVHQQAFFTNIDFDDLEAVLILKSLKESNH